MARTITLTFDDGTTHQYQNAPDDITPDAVMARASQEFAGKGIVNIDGGRGQQAAPEPVQQQEQLSLFDSLSRQAGLTGRYIIEGGADLAGIAADPVAAALHYAGVPNMVSTGALGRSVADSIGLPKPENPVERIVAVPSKLLVGTGGIVKGATSAASNMSNSGRSIMEFLAARPGLQAASAAGAGLSGGVAQESGASPTAQVLATIAGGIAAPVAVNAAQNLGRTAVNLARNVVSPPNASAAVDDVIQRAGVIMDDLPNQVREGLRNDVAKAMSAGDDVSVDAIRRLADYRAAGLNPMRSNLTLNPADVTREQNLMKLAANSDDPAIQALANNRNVNNAQLIRNLNEAGADQADDAVVAGGKVISALKQRDDAARSTIGKLYDHARNADGRSARLDPSAFTQKANNLLDEKLLGGKLPSDVRNLLNKAANGEMPLTVDVAEQFKTRLGDLQRASRDPAERLALSQVRQALDDTPLLDGQGQAAIAAFNKARRANRAYMFVVERTPALQAVRDGIEPDQFVQRFITGRNVNVKDLDNLKRAVKTSPEALRSIKSQMIQYLKEQATGGAADEVAKVSQSSFNKALRNIGDQKLGIFFTNSEIENLRRLGRVASYEQFQPAGSAVNNSNTAAANFGYLLERIADNKLIRSLPLGEAVFSNPARNAANAWNSRNVMNTSKALTRTNPAVKAPKRLPYAAGVAATGMTLSSE